MATLVSHKFTGKWKRLKHLVDAERFRVAAHHNIGRATKFNGMLVVAEMRKRIKGKKYSPNAELTTLLKRSKLPLIDHALMFKAITSVVIDDKTVFAGVTRRARGKKGEPLADIALALHEGTTIQVTPAMRGLFFALAAWTKYHEEGGTAPAQPLMGRALELFNKVKGKGRIYPLNEGTTAIVIPGRPFIKEVFEDAGVLKAVKQNWQRAMDAALVGRIWKTSSGLRRKATGK